jgi:hypothetical protein
MDGPVHELGNGRRDDGAEAEAVGDIRRLDSEKVKALRQAVPRLSQLEHLLECDLVPGDLDLGTKGDLLSENLDDRARFPAGVDGVQNEKRARALDQGEKSHSENAAVQDFELPCAPEPAAQGLEGVNAYALVPVQEIAQTQDDVAAAVLNRGRRH